MYTIQIRHKSCFTLLSLVVHELLLLILFRKLADGDQDGALTLHEFCVAMKLVLIRRKGDEIPSSLPESLVQLRKKQGKCYITLHVLARVYN